MERKTDGQLVERCLRGDLGAFEMLVERHRSAMLRLAESRLGQTADAEDAAQEAFVQAYFGLPRLREPAKFLPWLRAIVERRCLMIRRGAREQTLEPAAAERLRAEGVTVPEGRLDEALAKLPEAMRQTVNLVYGAGYNYAETAEALGVPEGTIKSRVSRAKAILRKELRVMEQTVPYSPFTSEVTERLMQRARDLVEQGEYEAAGEPLDEVLNIQFENGSRFDPEALRMAERIWEEMRRRDAEANAHQYGRSLEDVDWRVGEFNTLSRSLDPPGGEGADLWGVPRGAVGSLLDARDVCRRMKVSPVTLHEWLQMGMPAIRYSPWVRFDYDRVRQWLAERRIEPEPEATPAQASNPVEILLAEIEAGRLSGDQAERVMRGLGLNCA